MFYLSKSVALGVADFLRSEGIRAAIKWPNDIYVADKKICGILIEQRICGERIAQSVVGVGLNVNQRRFAAPHATSMRRCDGKVRSLREALAALAAAILRRYEALRAGGEAQGWAEVDREYAERLYRGSGFFPYRCGGKTFSACVDAALPSGELVLRLEDGTRRCFAFKEVEFVR
jgi:BirA family biotin operon repressor/biotin-[acetyl-CoA-carboxylase] ligase